MRLLRKGARPPEGPEPDREQGSLPRAFIDLYCLPSGRTDRIANTREAIASWLALLRKWAEGFPL